MDDAKAPPVLQHYKKQFGGSLSSNVHSETMVTALNKDSSGIATLRPAIPRSESIYDKGKPGPSSDKENMFGGRPVCVKAASAAGSTFDAFSNASSTVAASRSGAQGHMPLGATRGDLSRRSLTSHDELQKLHSDFNSLQEQFQLYQQAPTSRRDSLTTRNDDRIGLPSSKAALPPPAGRPMTSHEDMQKLQSDFNSLQEQYQQYQQVPTGRRDSLTSRCEDRANLPPPAPVGRHVTALAPNAQPSTPAVGSIGDTQAASHDTGNLTHTFSTAAVAAGGAGSEALFAFPSGLSGSQAGQAAVEAFEDAELSRLVEQGLAAQLTSSKAGADDKFRINELAGIVKTLRRCVRELGSRASLYVERCIKIERDAERQLESVRLASECSVKSLEAELARAQKDLAGFETRAMADRALRGGELEGLKSEVSRLRRELDRMTEEREQAKAECQRATQAVRAVEAELKDLRRQNSQAMREVNAGQSEAIRAATCDKDAAERREAALREDKQKLSHRLESVTACAVALEQELATLREVHAQQTDALRSRDILAAQAVQLRQDLATAVEQLQVSQAELQQLRESATGSQAEAAELVGQLDATRRQLAEVRNELAVERRDAAHDRDQAAHDADQAAASQRAAREREASLTVEKSAFKAGLQDALAQKDQALVMLEALRRENTNLSNQVEFATSGQAAAEAEAAELRAELAKQGGVLAAAQQQASDKEARLALLEGQFEALKEVLGDAGGQRDVVQNLLSRIAALQGAVASTEAIRRRLHNELVEVKGNIRVFCRVRPHPAPAVRCQPDGTGVVLCTDGKEHAFAYDRVFGPASSQQDVFEAVSELVQSALDGYHVCLFSYGQTGAGKTHTMQGVPGSPQQQGIVPRAVQKILEASARLQAEQEWQYSMEASCIEVYNDKLRDLLSGQASGYISDASAIKHDGGGGHTTVAGVVRLALTNLADAAELVKRAAAARVSQATAMNAESSRSHSIFMLYITGEHPPSGTRLQGCLCLVDLAGSERLARSLAEDQRKKEACAINQSLSALGDVFGALSSRSAHVPYRNSKLTYLLQPCLGGHGKTLMFVNINPEPASAQESLCSLKFAAKVNGCETGAKGGARRHVAGPLAAAPSSSGAADAAATKRYSLPGQPKTVAAASTASEPATKRTSLTGHARTTVAAAGGTTSGTGGVSALSAGSKRLASNAMPPAGAGAKKSKQ